MASTHLEFKVSMGRRHRGGRAAGTTRQRYRGRAVSAALPIPVIQLLQVLTVAFGAPGVTGVIAKAEARMQGRRGPRVMQPYYDLAKLARKESLAPEQASWSSWPPRLSRRPRT